MSLDVDGFTNEIEGGDVLITVDSNHKLLKLAGQLPWDDMLEAILPDMQRTEKCYWWLGRPLRVRIHLGVYLLQKMYNLTDRMAEQQVRDNADFRSNLECCTGDHTLVDSPIVAQSACRH